MMQSKNELPQFRSTEQSFIVIFKNLNYGKVSMLNRVEVGIENGIEVGMENAKKKLNNTPKGPKHGKNGANSVKNGVVKYEDEKHGIEVGIENGIENNEYLILLVLANEPKITQKRLSELTDLSMRTVARELKNLRDKNKIHRVGSDRAGYWEIIK